MTRLPYYAPPDANSFLKARQELDPDTGAIADIQQIEDLGAHQRLTSLRTELSALLTSIRDNTDTLEVTLGDVDLNTDELEARTEAVRAAIATFEATFTARDLASVASITNLRDTLNTAIAGASDEAVVAAVDAFRSAFNLRDLASVASVTDLRDVLVTAIGSASDEAVVSAVDAFRTSFNTRDLATSARQDAILTELQRKANSTDALLARPTLEVRQRQGLAFISSTGRLNITTTGHFRATVRNPATHTRIVYLQRLVFFCSAGPAYANVYINPTVNLPTAALRPVNNSRVGNPTTSPVEVRADTSTTDALGGGIDTGIVLALPAGRSIIELSPMSVPPNVTMGLNIPFAGASDVVMTSYFYEESI